MRSLLLCAVPSRGCLVWISRTAWFEADASAMHPLGSPQESSEGGLTWRR